MWQRKCEGMGKKFPSALPQDLKLNSRCDVPMSFPLPKYVLLEYNLTD